MLKKKKSHVFFDVCVKTNQTSSLELFCIVSHIVNSEGFGFKESSKTNNSDPNATLSIFYLKEINIIKTEQNNVEEKHNKL